MRKRTKKIMSGVLILSILFGTPACMESAEAANQIAVCRERIVGFQWDLASRYPDWGEELEIISEIHSEIMSDGRSEAESEETSEKESEILSEAESENLSEGLSEICSEETSSECIPGEITDEIVESESNIDDGKFTAETDVAGLRTAYVVPKISDDGELDYRTYLDHDAVLRLIISESDSLEELTGASYQIIIDNTGVVDFGEVDGSLKYNKASAELTTAESSISLKINGVGETKYTVKALGLPGYDAEPYSGSIKVKNSPLCDSDFYIERTRDGQVQRYEYDAWIAYLKTCKEWVNDKVEVKLTDTGKHYFDSIEMREEGTSGIPGYATNLTVRMYVFWAENSDRNASTKDVENGTRSYVTGSDTDVPVLKSFSMESKCYEPTETETEQYFAEDFILKGTFADDVSGVSRVEYTTDFLADKDIVWVEAETAQHPEAHEWVMPMIDFQITLPDGCYPAIAVRAYDAAGNASEVKGYVNDKGEYIKVVVDSTEPILIIDVTSDGQPYNGENDNWTNSDVRLDITLDKDSSPYAGIYQCEYAYMKIGESMTHLSERWTRLSAQNRSVEGFTVTEDKNGYIFFRAVSKSGVKTKDNVEQRVLIQHHAAEIKPLIISGADETKCKDGWYNKESGTPVISFEYPDYDTGVISKEYDAPITVHYRLTKEAEPSEGTKTGNEMKETSDADGIEQSAVIGVMSSEDVTVHADGSKEFVLTKDNLNQHVINFGYDNEAAKEAQDGIYILEYWTTDNAGNESEKQTCRYKIDCHEPTDLTMELDGDAFAVGEESAITYERFYQDTVSGSAGAQYGISGKGALKILKAKKIGEWKDMDSDSLEDADNISISPNTRCFLYIRAEDKAGNAAEGWTNGIVVDNMAPNEANSGKDKELIIEPKGANEHGFFNGDVTVDISVKDAPADDNCAALKSVTSAVGRDGTDTVADRELFSFTKELPTEDEIIEASDFQGTQLIDAKANESNEAYIEVTAVDRSGNVKTSTHLLKIDVTKPQIDISFDNNDALNGSYYRQGRVATIHVHELNFDADAVSVSVTKNGQPYDIALSGWTSDGSDHYATVAFAEDGDYQIKASCVDLADNASEEVQSEAFTIDCTAPEIAIEIIAGQETQVSDKDCFNTDVTAVITVTEHNFRAQDLVINMTPVSEKQTWSHEGDIHTLHIPFAGDNTYHIDCAYTDMAGNPANIVEKDFIIDTIAPVIVIEGVADGSANAGEILPVISVLDLNIDASDILVSVMTGIGDTVENAIETNLMNDENAVGCRLTLTDMTEKPDNVYHLAVSARDRAGNEAELTCRFSLNRNGSVYDLSSLLELMEKQYSTYSGLGEIQIVEMNIDTVEEFELYVSRNGAIGYPAEYTKQVSGTTNTGYTYLYNIKKENFAEEGTYRLSLYSRDRAGNEVNNATDINGNEISFVIDNTAPKVVIDGVESGKVYDVESQEVHVSVTDNFKLAEAELTLVNKANEVLDSWDYVELAGEDGELNITISQYNEAVSLLYRVKDAAGNEIQTFQGEQTALADFLVTTDRFVQFINKPVQTPFGRMILFVTGVSAAVILLMAAMMIRNRKRCCSGIDISRRYCSDVHKSSGNHAPN